jgi:hypothetical protein
LFEPQLTVHAAVQPTAAVDEMRVADVQQAVMGTWVLGHPRLHRTLAHDRTYRFTFTRPGERHCCKPSIRAFTEKKLVESGR